TLLERLEASLAGGEGTEPSLAQAQSDSSARRLAVDNQLAALKQELNAPFDEDVREQLLTLLKELEEEFKSSVEPDDLPDVELLALLESLRDALKNGQDMTTEEQRLAQSSRAAAERLRIATNGLADADEQLDIPRRTLNVNAPIAREHADRKWHRFFVQAGRIVAYPHEEINELAFVEFRSELNNQRNHSFSGSVGPIDGWVGEYTGQVTVSGNRISLSKWSVVFVPPEGEWGEPLESCLEEGHAFQEYLQQLDPEKDRLFFVLYGDSFGSYAEFEGVLVEQGFAVGVFFLEVGQELSSGSGGITVTER
ncbi:MAG: hypothetical protein ACI8QS_002421, partial [Planctomycetota bacterium]